MGKKRQQIETRAKLDGVLQKRKEICGVAAAVVSDIKEGKNKLF